MEKIDHRKMKYLNKSETLEALKVCITRSRNKFYFLDYFVEKLVMNQRGMELKTFSSFLLLFFFFIITYKFQASHYHPSADTSQLTPV